MDATRRNRSLGDRPLVVLSATDVMEGMNAEIVRINQQMHAELATLSTRGQHVVLPGTDHYSLLMDQADAAVVASAIGNLIAEAAVSSPGDGN